MIAGHRVSQMSGYQCEICAKYAFYSPLNIVQPTCLSTYHMTHVIHVLASDYVCDNPLPNHVKQPTDDNEERMD